MGAPVALQLPGTHHPPTSPPSRRQQHQQPRALQKSQFYFIVETTNQEERKRRKKTKTNPETTPKNEKRPQIRTRPVPRGCYIQAGGLGGSRRRPRPLWAPRTWGRSGSSRGGVGSKCIKREVGIVPHLQGGKLRHGGGGGGAGAGRGGGVGGMKSSPWQPSPCKRSHLRPPSGAPVLLGG